MTPDLFDCIKRVARGTQGERQLTEAIRVLLNERDFYVHVIEGSRYKAGDKIGYIKQSLILSSKDPIWAEG